MFGPANSNLNWVVLSLSNTTIYWIFLCITVDTRLQRYVLFHTFQVLVQVPSSSQLHTKWPVSKTRNKIYSIRLLQHRTNPVVSHDMSLAFIRCLRTRVVVKSISLDLWEPEHGWQIWLIRHQTNRRGFTSEGCPVAPPSPLNPLFIGLLLSCRDAGDSCFQLTATSYLSGRRYGRN